MITKLTFHKAIKKNLGNYNMLEAGYGMEVSLEKGEIINQGKIWEEINQQINIQASTTDPEWLQKKDE